ncbi:winged helix-turn-helix transcriptional regulator [Teredinibacter haidensis]|uniref:winged helix-turn-helix transcriptional regulator n=1 Tax=Teredinibacter haidensis TaxID=2731755 RepID=UPI00094915A1|nr:helix-turn-helix domain-containing protein [Teredinibacter haidensis]
MKASQHFSVNCPCRVLFSEIADKWSMMIMSVLEEQPRRFNDIKRRLEGVSQKSLTQTLRKLERNGLVLRDVKDTSPISVEYSMSDLGVSLLPSFKAIYKWTVDNYNDVQKARQYFDSRQ